MERVNSKHLSLLIYCPFSKFYCQLVISWKRDCARFQTITSAICHRMCSGHLSRHFGHFAFPTSICVSTTRSKKSIFFKDSRGCFKTFRWMKYGWNLFMQLEYTCNRVAQIFNTFIFVLIKDYKIVRSTKMQKPKISITQFSIERIFPLPSWNH